MSQSKEMTSAEKDSQVVPVVSQSWDGFSVLTGGARLIMCRAPLPLLGSARLRAAASRRRRTREILSVSLSNWPWHNSLRFARDSVLLLTL